MRIINVLKIVAVCATPAMRIHSLLERTGNTTFAVFVGLLLSANLVLANEDSTLDPASLAKDPNLEFALVRNNNGSKQYYLVSGEIAYPFGCSDLNLQQTMFEAIGYNTAFIPQIREVDIDSFTAGITVERRAAILCARDDINLRYRRIEKDDVTQFAVYLTTDATPTTLYRIGCVGMATAYGLPILSAEIIRDADIVAYDISEARIPCFDGKIPTEPELTLNVQPSLVSVYRGTVLPTIHIGGNHSEYDNARIEMIESTCDDVDWITFSGEKIEGIAPEVFPFDQCDITLRSSLGKKISNSVRVSIRFPRREPPVLNLSGLPDESQEVLSVVQGSSIPTITFTAYDVDQTTKFGFTHAITPDKCTWLSTERNDRSIWIQGQVPRSETPGTVCRVEVFAESKFGITTSRALIITVLPRPNVREEIWTGTMSIGQFDCSKQGVESVTVKGEVFLKPEVVGEPIKITCKNVRFTPNSLIRTAADLRLVIDNEICGPIKIEGNRGIATPTIGAPGKNGGENSWSGNTSIPRFGGDGVDGGDGMDGRNGAHANDILLAARNACTDTTVEISAIGGPGGDGGPGGKGGSGRNGQQRGGNGGDGGNGGMGGDGGNGGNVALHGGSSFGPIEVKIDVQGGSPGDGGAGGAAGRGGTAAHGGVQGQPGRDGNPGQSGIAGQNGTIRKPFHTLHAE